MAKLTTNSTSPWIGEVEQTKKSTTYTFETEGKFLNKNIEFKVKNISVAPDRKGNTVFWESGWVEKGSSTGTTTEVEKNNNTISWRTGWVEGGSLILDPANQSLNSYNINATGNNITIIKSETQPNSGKYIEVSASGSVITNTEGYITTDKSIDLNKKVYYVVTEDIKDNDTLTIVKNLHESSEAPAGYDYLHISIAEKDNVFDTIELYQGDFLIDGVNE